MSTDIGSGGNAQFAPALLDPDLDLPDGVVGPDGNPSNKRFSVYRNNVVVSLLTALKQNYPSLHAILGDEKFSTLARAFISKHPPRSAMMQKFGDLFPEFLKNLKALEQSPFLFELAELENAWLIAYHALDADIVGPAVLSEFPAERVGEVVFKPHPATHLQRSEYAICDLFGRRYDVSDDIETGNAQAVLVTRPHLDVEVRQIALPDFAFLNALYDGAQLGEAIAAGSQFCEETGETFDPASSITLLLESGAFTTATLD